MADTEDYRGSDMKLYHQTLRVMGFAPYFLGATPEDTHLDRAWTVYNILQAILIAGNAWYSEGDTANSGAYTNKTQVVDIAYDAVDVFANFYLVTFIVYSIFRYKKASVLYFSIIKNNQTFRSIGIHFELGKLKVQFTIKLGLLLALSGVVTALNIYLEVISGNYYTIFYWIAVMYPKFIASIIVFVFVTTLQALYQKLWALNEFIRVYMKAYKHRRDCHKREHPLYHYDEKVLEEFVLRQYMISKKQTFFTIPSKVKPLLTPGKRFKPQCVMIKNFPKCFEKKICDILKELRLLRQVQFEVFELGSFLGSIMGSHFIFIFVICFFGCTINLYAAVTFHVIGLTNGEYIACVLWTAIYFGMTYSTVKYCAKVTDEADETKILIHKFWTMLDSHDVLFDAELQSFVMQVAFHPIQFSAAGFFTINYPLLFSFVVGVISNVIFIVQFDKLNTQEDTQQGHD